MVASQTQQQQLYSHGSEPKPVAQRKTKYREQQTQPVAAAADEAAEALGTNIMFDRRVVRGNTYAARILPAEPALAQSAKASMKKKATSRQGAPPRTPEAVEGRRHMDVQTDLYLEELTDTIPEADCFTQTDAFMDRPPTPIFVPTKLGTDVATQIEGGDLFDFDLEVEPILEVLVGKVLEQGLMEVLEEEELAAMRNAQAQFEAARAAELVAVQRLEEAERRKAEEKDRRVAQEQKRLERERTVRQKVAASTFARGYLDGIIGSVFSQLQESGFFYDPVEREVDQEFLPWLQQQAALHLANGVVARHVVDELVKEAVARLAAAAGDREDRVALLQAVADAHAAQEAALTAQAAAEELDAIRRRATQILRAVQPPLAQPALLEQVAGELAIKNQNDSNAAYEAESARVSAEAKAALEAEALERRALYEQAVANAEEGGQEPPMPPAELQPAELDAAAAAAVATVPKPVPAEVTDGDILSALMDRNQVTKEAIIQALALEELGAEAHSKRFPPS